LHACLAAEFTTLLSGANISQVSPDKKRNAGWGRSEGCGTIRFDNTFTTRLSTNGMSTAFYLSAIKKGIILFDLFFRHQLPSISVRDAGNSLMI